MKTSKIVFLFLTWLVLMATVMTVSAQDVPTGLVRVKSGRTGYYLSTAKAGSATTTARNLNTYNQVWVLLPSGNGYSLRSANTGEYLQAAYATPGSGQVTLYIRKSPNATATKALFNISSDSGFGGSFLNTNTGYGLFSYSMDGGCDWYIEAVTNYTLEDVQQRLLDQSPYAGALSEGKYYRVISYYGRALQDAEVLGGDVTTQPIDAKEVAQYWTLKKVDDDWKLENVLTQRFLLRQSDQSKPYRTTTAANAAQFHLQDTFSITRVANDWEYQWTIAVPGETQGLHDSETQSHNVVRWGTAAAASVWQFQEVELSQEDIDAARGKLSDLDDVIAEFKEISGQKSALQKELDALFADKACTTLKEDIAALTDEELAQNEHFAALTGAMKEMVLKVKNNTWQQYTNGDYTADYERFFRVADYHVYSNHITMANASNFTMSNPFGRLSGPTGIVADKGDIIYIYVSATPSSYAELMLEAVSTEGVAGANPTGTQTPLRAGINLVQFTEKKVLYVLYQLKASTTGSLYTRLSRYNDITVHIEGGQLNGYWDATRGMTNADWKLLQKDLLKASPYVNLKTRHLVFQMDKSLLLAAEPNEMEGLMRVWDKIVENEDRYMGVEDFDGKYNNIWNAFSGASSYMHATDYGTWYSEGTISTVMNYQKMITGGGNLWGPSHEIGHNHQGSINVIGTTESSNNLFSNINTFESGILNSRRFYPFYPYGNSDEAKSAQDYFANQVPWLGRNIWYTTGMFFQLYLYFHVQGHDPNFYPNLFRKMRKSPINKWSGPGNGITSYGKDDYLHLAKMICDVAQADLSEFFEAYGMFIPVDKFYVSDYADYYVTTSQADINAAKAYMKKYEKKLGNIMFIDDRIIKKKADPDNIFGCVPAADGNKRANNEYPYLMASTTSAYVGGDYESYTDDAQPVTDDWYKLSSNGKTITFQGTKNYAGHKFYDLDGNFIWATNKRSVALPEVVTDLGMANVVVVTANYDMSDTPCSNTNAILDIRTGESAAGHEVIDLTGRRLHKPTQAGIYIIDGKKVFVK